jgi:hypothetical protein
MKSSLPYGSTPGQPGFRKYLDQNYHLHRRVLTGLLLAMLALSSVAYFILRILFHDFNFSLKEELVNGGRVIIAGTSIGFILYLLFAFIELLDITIRQWRSMRTITKISLPAILIFIVVVIASCTETKTTAAGVKKDISTGLTSNYTVMEPGKIMLVMNNEVLNHTDIPVGEKFMLINDDISGMKIVDGKVSVGCSLIITDTTGKAIFKDDDLFKDGGIFKEKEARMLKCTVSTGEPMQSEEYYKVHVRFWDKNGKGAIDNKVTIHMIDMP